ncbi:MAG: hypothetical protein FWC80_01610 [Firmicutes bacterium]|nr:hypothetical protein [Bacillota bacterium]
MSIVIARSIATKQSAKDKKVVCTPNMNFSRADCFVPRKDDSGSSVDTPQNLINTQA